MDLPRLGTEPVPCTGRQILSHCTTRGILAAAPSMPGESVSLTSSWVGNITRAQLLSSEILPHVGTEVMLLPGTHSVPVSWCPGLLWQGAELGEPAALLELLAPQGSWNAYTHVLTSPVPCRRSVRPASQSDRAMFPAAASSSSFSCISPHKLGMCSHVLEVPSATSISNSKALESVEV